MQNVGVTEGIGKVFWNFSISVMSEDETYWNYFLRVRNPTTPVFASTFGVQFLACSFGALLAVRPD